MTDEEKWKLLIETTKRFLRSTDPSDQQRIDGLLDRLNHYQKQYEEAQKRAKRD